MEDLMRKRYVASMVLGGVGDALGYRNGTWEFCDSGKVIHQQLKKLGGLSKIIVNKRDWRVSDDTVMHLATADALLEYERKLSDPENFEDLYHIIADKYKECMKDMDGRAPGNTCSSSCNQLQPYSPNGYQIPFCKWHGGCGGAMRSMCIGLYYYKPEDMEKLIAVGIESGRITHHHPIGYLGSLASALFTHYAINDKPLREWGAGLMKTLPKALDYIKSQRRDVKENKDTWDTFGTPWKKYLKIRGIEDGKTDPMFPEGFEDVCVRDDFYSKEFSFNGCAGASGNDAPLVAYDALLACDGSWEKLSLYAALHGGDSDSTGSIAAAWFGAVYGFNSVPECHYQELEYRDRLELIATVMFTRRQSAGKPDTSETGHAAVLHGTSV